MVARGGRTHGGSRGRSRLLRPAPWTRPRPSAVSPFVYVPEFTCPSALCDVDGPVRSADDLLWNAMMGPGMYDDAAGERHQAAVMEEYKLLVEMADRVPRRLAEPAAHGQAPPRQGWTAPHQVRAGAHPGPHRGCSVSAGREMSRTERQSLRCTIRAGPTNCAEVDRLLDPPSTPDALPLGRHLVVRGALQRARTRLPAPGKLPRLGANSQQVLVSWPPSQQPRLGR
jgi:hypothetical protein